MRSRSLTILLAFVAFPTLASGTATADPVRSLAAPTRPGIVESVTVEKGWYDRTNRTWRIAVGGKPGAPCALKITLTNRENGLRYSFTEFGPIALPRSLTSTWSSSEPAPGHYTVRVEPGSGKDAEGKALAACTGSATAEAQLLEAELGHPVGTIAGARWWDTEYFLPTGSTKDKMVSLEVPGTIAGKNQTTHDTPCAATVEIHNRTLNLRHFPTLELVDGKQLNVAALIRQYEGSVNAGEFEILFHSTPQNQTGGAPCIGEAKLPLKVVSGNVIRPGFRYASNQVDDPYARPGQTYRHNEVTFLPVIDGDACNYSVIVEPPPQYGNPSVVDGQRKTPAPDSPVTFRTQRTLRYRVTVAARPGLPNPCNGRWSMDDVAFPHSSGKWVVVK